MAVTLDLGKGAFVVHMAYLGSKMSIHPICKIQIALLLAKKVTILAKYLDYSDIFLKELAIKLFKHFNIHKYLINLKLIKQSPYGSNYNLGLVKLEILKTYIKNNLANSFI